MSRLELLHTREDAWRKRLSPTRISLVAEDVATKSKHTEQALKLLGQRWLEQEPHSSAVLRRFPAVQVLTTTRVATDHYAASFWPQLCDLAGIPREPWVQQAWGTAYLENLEHLGLPTFDDVEDAGSRFVGPILMHSGVPTYCLPDLMRLIRDRRRQVPGVTPEVFIDWAAERARQERLWNVDKPVQRFLRYGGEFAVDVVDRVFELLDVVAAGGNGQDVELPARFIDAAVELRDTGEDLSARTPGSRETTVEAPRRATLMLDPYGRGPFVRLPSIPDADEGQVVWVVGADAEEERVASMPLLPGYREPTPQVDVPINRPVRQVSARLEGSSALEFTVPVVDAERPLLIFDEEGMPLSLGSPLRGSAVWAMHPDTSTMVAPSQDQVISEAALPPGWGGWHLLLLDLRGVSEVRLDDGTAVAVQARAVPRILMPEPLPGVRTMGGEPVFAQLPDVDLPDLGAEDGPTWSVSLLDHTGALLVRREVRTVADSHSLWDSAPATLCGEVLLRVRGPWGRAATRRFTVISDLSAASTPEWRRMTGRGLVPTTVDLAAADGIRLSRTRLELGGSQVRDVVWVSTGPERLNLVVEPPHMAVSHLTPTRTGPDTVTALRLQTEALLEDPGVLALSTGAQADPRLHAFGREGLVQVLEPQAVTSPRTPVYRFPLNQLTDTLRAEQQLRLTLDPEGQLPLAFIRPGRLFSGLRIEDGVLHLDDSPEIEGLTAICYRSMAPWSPPAVRTVEDGRVKVPDDFVAAGPLLVQVRIDDPWVPEPVPDWPQTYTWASQPGRLTTGPDDEVALSGLLAGEAQIEDYEGRLEPVWLAYDRLWKLGLAERAGTVDSTLRTLLLDRATDALAALARCGLAPERVPVVLARSGLASAPIQDDVGATSSVTLRHANVLPLTFMGGWVHDDSALDQLISVCGAVTRDLIAGSDPVASVGGFDLTADLLANMSGAQRATIYRTAGIVPAGLLDHDSRVLGAEAVLANRDSSRLQWLRKTAERINSELRQTFQVIGLPGGTAAMDARRHPHRPHGWRAIPEWSIGMAFACRVAAHRGLELPVVQAGSRALEDLATIAPHLVTIDLVIAELLVRAHMSEEDRA